jgi:hypothetical protein
MLPDSNCRATYHTLQFRTYLKNVFWPHIFVGASFQILDNHQVACGFKLGPAAPVPAKPLFSHGEDGIWNQNPIFEMGSSTFPKPDPSGTVRVNSYTAKADPKF